MNRILYFSFTTLLFVCIIFSNNLSGQSLNNGAAQEESKSFFDIQREFNDFWAPYDVDNDGYYTENGIRKKAGGWKQFKRWEWFWEYRIDPETGAFPATSAAEIYEQIQSSGTRSSAGSWSSLGPNSSSGGYAGIGRLNCVVEQSVTGDLYAGSPSGGLWKSTNGGSSWTALTDNNSVLGVSTIVVVPTAGDDIVYIGTGDRDGGSMWSLSGGQSNDNNSIGVLKSTDGGTTWLPTGLTYSPSQKETVNRLVMDPNNSHIIYAATSDGIYKTTDGGVTWPAQILGYNFIDLEMNPANSSILYASTQDYSTSPAIYRSTDGGSSWSAVATFAAGDYRVELGVTPANSSRVYAIVAQQSGALSSIQRSTNTGASFSQVFGSATNMLGWYCLGSDASGQGGYDLCIAVDPSNENTLFIGGVNTWKSTNGGSSWSNNNMWTSSSTYNSCGSPVVHADKHDLVFFGSTLYECNDGGLYKTTNGGSSWTHISNGMKISQLYRIGVAQTTPDEVMAGLQDNGSKLYWSGTWYDVMGGDGMECLIDYTNVNTQYGTFPRGDIVRTTTHWSGGTYVTPASAGDGAWVTPIVIDPNTNTTLVAGYNDIWRSTNRGTSWSKISTINNSDKVRCLAIAPSNSNYIYAGYRNVLYRTTNGGSSWSNISGSLPVSSSYITYVSVKDDDPNTVWVSMGEYNIHGVYQTTNGGSTWTNITAGIPNIPVMCVIQNTQNTTETELYAGTDLGVYAKVGSSNWFAYNNGLPNVVVTELEIYYDNNPSNSLLRAATFGRGLWESDLFSPSTSPPTAEFNADDTTPQVGQTVTFTDLTTDNPNTWSWSFSPNTVSYVNSTTSSSENPQVQFNSPGFYTVTLLAANGNGNDTEAKTNYIDAYECNVISSFPYTMDFDSWTRSNPAAACTPDASVLLDNCWENLAGDNVDWDVNYGSTASSTTGPAFDHTGGGNYLYIEASGCFSKTASIISPTFDLNGITSPELSFWYHMYGADMGTLSVQVSTDGGSTWSSNIWSLSGDQGNLWHEQVISLDAYASETDLVIRFTGSTGTNYRSDMSIDDFNLDGVPVPSPQNQQTTLSGGWNIMSFYVIPGTSLDMVDIYQTLIDDGSLVKISDEAGGIVQYITGVGWLNTIGNMSNTEGYYVNLNAEGSLTTTGSSVIYPYDIPLYSGWNIMGYPSDAVQTAMTVLQPLLDDGYLVKVLSESGGIIQYINGVGWINTIVNFIPTEGYYINVNTDCTLPINEVTKSSAPQSYPLPVTKTEFFSNPLTNPFSPMNIIVRDILADGFEVEDGDELAVYDGDLHVGSAVIASSGAEYYSIVAGTDDPVTEITDGFIPGNEITFQYWDKSEDQVYSGIEATYISGDERYNPLGTYVGELKISSLGTGEAGLPGGTFLGQNFPNPYTENTHIEYGIAEDARVMISVHDVSGRTIMVLQNTFLSSGKYRIEMNKASLEPGVYYYRMEAQGSSTNFSETRKMVLY